MKSVASSAPAAVLAISVLFAGTPVSASAGSGFTFPNYSVGDFFGDMVSIFTEIAGMDLSAWNGFGTFLSSGTFIGGAPFSSISNVYFVVCLAFMAFCIVAALVSAKVFPKEEAP